MLMMSKNKKNDDTFTTKSNVVSERQKAVIETIRMRLTEKQSIGIIYYG